MTNLKIMTRLILICMLYGLASCNRGDSKKPAAQSHSSQGPMQMPVEGYIIVPETIKPSLVIAGTLLPMEETEIHPEVSGRVVSLTVKEGSYVTAGTILARLFDDDLQAQLRKLKVQLQVAEQTEQRQSDLLKIGGISQQDYDLSLLSVSGLKADIDILQINIDKMTVRAPFNGILGFKNISLGAYITTQTVITTIRKTDVLKLQFSVPEKYSKQVSLGNKVTFTTEANTHDFEAVIRTTESGINYDTRSLDVHALVMNNSNLLRPGAFANVNFPMGEEDRAVMVPSQAVIPGARDKQIIVFNGGKAAFKVIETGTREEEMIEVTRGLAIGDTVITTGLLSIKPGTEIRISSYTKNNSK